MALQARIIFDRNIYKRKKRVERFEKLPRFRTISFAILFLFCSIFLVFQKQATHTLAAQSASGTAQASGTNKYGMGVLSLDDNQFQWTKALVGTNGYIKYVFSYITRDFQGPKPEWIAAVNKAFDNGLIPVVRLDSEWQKNQLCFDDASCQEEADALVRIVNGFPHRGEMWIEINNEMNFNNGTIYSANPQKYGLLLLKTARGIQSLGDIRIKVMNGGLAPDWGIHAGGGLTTSQYIRDMINANPQLLTGRGGQPVIDAWAVHPYPESTPPDSNYHTTYAGNIDSTIPAIDSYIPELKFLTSLGLPSNFPVMITETGYMSNPATNFPFTQAQRADYMRRAMELYNSWPEVKAVIPFVLSDFSITEPGHGQFFQEAYWVPFSGGTNPDGTPTSPYPVYTAVREGRLGLPSSLPTIAPADPNPVDPAGGLDGLNAQGQMRGWGCDVNAPGHTTSVHLYADGNGWGTFLGIATADQPGESAIGGFCDGTTNHRFVFDLPQSVKDGKPHQIYGYAIGVGGGAPYKGVFNSPLTIQVGGTQSQTSTDPFGGLDGLNDQNQLKGWGCDADAVNQTTDVHFYADGDGWGTFLGKVTATLPGETGIGQFCNGSTNHRFLFDIPQSLKDGKQHQIYGYVIGVGGGMPYKQVWNSPQIIQIGNASEPQGGAGSDPAGGLNGLNDQGQMKGWGCDVDALDSMTTVHLYADGNGWGTFLGAATADQAGEAAIGQFCNGSTNHRFTFDIPNSLKDGQKHLIYGYAIGVGGGAQYKAVFDSPQTIQIGTSQPPAAPVVIVPSPTPLPAQPEPTPAPAAAVQAPQLTGWQDYITPTGDIVGWACDRANPERTVRIDVYIDGNGFGQMIGSTNADKTGDDPNAIADQCGGSGARRFIFQIPDSIRNTGNHIFYTYAIDPTNTHILVPNSGATFSLGEKVPFGYQRVEENNVTGWACDPDNFNQPIDVHVYIDGPAGSGRMLGETSANISVEQAVGYYCGGNPAHRFSFPLPAEIRDGNPHQIYVYGINIGSGSNNSLLQSAPSTIQ